MCLIAQIRALVTALVLASYSPIGAAGGPAESGQPGHLAVSIFVGRRTRVVASQEFDITHRVTVQLPAMRAISSLARACVTCSSAAAR